MTVPRMNPDELPEVRAKKIKREQDVTPKVLKWFSENIPTSVALEIKATNTRSMSPLVLKLHQFYALCDATSEKGIAHKIADSGRQLPFDAFILKNTPAYVVACFTSHSVCYSIPVEKWNGARITREGAWSGDIPYTHRIRLE